MSKCQNCESELSGRKTKFCSRECKNKSTNHIHQVYKNQLKRGLERKVFLVNLLGGKCKKCSYCKNLAAIEFHHRNPKEKEFQIDMRKCANSKWETLLHEAQKCDLLCSNCHAETHHPDFESNLIEMSSVGFEPTLRLPSEDYESSGIAR